MLGKATHHVVIVGAGFAGLRLAKCLARTQVQVILIDRSNHHVFQPLLYQVATAGLNPADIAAPVRHYLRNQKNTEVLMAEVQGINVPEKKVRLRGCEIPYDHLVIATGARHGYFGHDAWEHFAPGLKSISDATLIRRRILLAFERAEMEPDAKIREKLLTFVLVGAGPTGVEMAGAIAELAHVALAADFRHIDPRQARILLIEAGPRILSTFPPRLSEKAFKSLTRLGVEIKVNAKVEDISADGVMLKGKLIAAHTVIWTAGVVASQASQWLQAEVDQVGRVKVAPDLSLPGHPEIFVIGDTACALDASGKPLPGLAPVAIQQGEYVAKVIQSRVAGKIITNPFHYRDKGNLATIGRSSAVADLGSIRLSGWIAWITWLFVHIIYLIGFRNKLLVLIQWAWAYLTFQRGARLITSDEK